MLAIPSCQPWDIQVWDMTSRIESRRDVISKAIAMTATTAMIKTRDKGQGTRDKAQGTRHKAQGTRHKAQGTRDKGQGTRDKGQGTNDK